MHILGEDGCVTKKYIAYYNKNETLLKNFERDILFLFKNIHIIRGKVNSRTSLLMIQNKKINLFFREILPDYRSFSLKIPNFIRSKKLQIEFLKAFYDDEGCVAMTSSAP